MVNRHTVWAEIPVSSQNNDNLKFFVRFFLHPPPAALRLGRQLFAADIEFVLIDELARSCRRRLNLVQEIFTTLGEVDRRCGNRGWDRRAC